MTGEERQKAVEEYVMAQAQRRADAESDFADMTGILRHDGHALQGVVSASHEAVSQSELSNLTQGKMQTAGIDTQGSGAQRRQITGTDTQVVETQGNNVPSFGSRVLGMFGWSTQAPARSGDSNKNKSEQVPSLEGQGEIPDHQPLATETQVLPTAVQPTQWEQDYKLDFCFPGKAGAVAVGMFRNLFFAGLRQSGATDEDLHELRFKISAGPSDSVFIARLEGKEDILKNLQALNIKNLNVVGYLLQSVDEIVPVSKAQYL
jgi:hypothetical protein